MRLQFARQPAGQGLEKQIGAQSGQFVMQGRSCLTGSYGNGPLAENWPRIQAFVGAHDGNASFSIASQNGSLDGRGATPTGKKRGVDI